MRYLSILLLIGVTLKVNGQQINPVPDYIFRNSMSVGRNAPTDTSAYFSIGPRFGATRGFMPPMVTDTAAVTGTKRNGLLIYSIQRNSFLYWDSTGSRWSRIAANLDTLLLSTRAWRQKGDDSLAAIINTRTDTVNLLSTKAWRQKGIDSINAVNASGTGISGYITRWSGTKTMDTSQIFQQANRIGIGNTAPAYILDITGTLRNTGNAFFNTSSGESYFGTTTDAGDYRVQVSGNQLIIGNIGLKPSVNELKISALERSGTDGRNVLLNLSGGSQLTGTSSSQSSFLIAIGHGALDSVTTGNSNIAIGNNAMRGMKTGAGNVAIGNRAYNAGTSNDNVAIGANALLVATTGTNTMVGSGAGLSITTGGDNTGVGESVLQAVTTGAGNTAIGEVAMSGITTGQENTGVGRNALRSITTAEYNTGIGHGAMFSVTSGNRNVVAGNEAGRFLSIGGNNTKVDNSIYIGYDARPSKDSNTNEIVIGYLGRGNGSNTVTIGNSSTTDNYFFGALRTSAPPGGTAAAWRLGTVATVSPTSPNRTIEVSIGGTIYYIHAKTTND
jgi:hypothetical protein